MEDFVDLNIAVALTVDAPGARPRIPTVPRGASYPRYRALAPHGNPRQRIVLNQAFKFFLRQLSQMLPPCCGC